MKTVIKLTVSVVLVVVMALLFALPVMWLWNWLMPEIFGLVEINFWQGLGFVMLSGLLFKNNSSGN